MIKPLSFQNLVSAPVKILDYAQRFEYVVRFQEVSIENPTFIYKLIMSFELNGFISKQKCRI